MEQQEGKNSGFQAMILERVRVWKTAYDEAHYPRIGDYVTLAKRNRGDYFGAISQRVRNAWNGRLGKGLVTYPVVPRAMRSKTATAISTDIRLDFKSPVPDPEKEAAVQSAENIYLFLENLYWTEQLETSIAQLGMLGGFMGIRAEIEDGPAVGNRMLTGKKWNQKGATVYGCSDCGGTFDPEEIGLQPVEQASANEETPQIAESHDSQSMWQVDEESFEPFTPENDAPHEPKPAVTKYDASKTECPRCGKPTLVLETEEDYEYEDSPTGEFEKILAAKFDMNAESALLIRYDDLNAIGFKWERAHWFNYHPLVPVYELLAKRPALKDKLAKNSFTDWSDSTRWYYELSKARGNIGTPDYSERSYLDSYAETDYWFIQPIACKGWKEPVGWTLFEDGSIGAFGEQREGVEAVFDIDVDETVEDAFKRREPDEPFHGLMVEMWEETVIDVRNASFMDFWTLFGWQVDASSSIPMGEERLNNLQDACTNVLSMIYSMTLRFSSPKGVADGKFFREGDLTDNQPGRWIFAKQDMQSASDDELVKMNVLNKVGYIVPPSPPSLVDMFVNLIIQISKEESGVFDETVGNVNPQNQTASGRQGAINQSLSLMTPTQKAKKHGKVAWARMMLKLWQRYAPEEAYKLVKGTYEDEWKAQDVEAFKALDISNEILIDAIEGTDIPKSRSDYEERFFAAMQMGLFDPMSPIPLEIRAKVIKVLGLVDVDIDNYEADRRLAARRKEVMMQIAEEFASLAGGYDKLIAIVPDPATVTPEDPNGIPVRKLAPDLILTIQQDPRTRVAMEDNHLTFIGYYTDQLKGIRGARQPREVDIMLLESANDAHRAMIAMKSAQAASAEGVVANAGVDQGSLNLPSQKAEAAAMQQNAGAQMPPPVEESGSGAPV